jgi:soluble lytic murein transglycosylase-like protein
MWFATDWPARVARPLGVTSAACVAIGVIASTPVPLAAPRDGAQLPAPAFASVQTSMDAGQFEEALAALDRDAGSSEPGELERLLLRARVLERVALQEPSSEPVSSPASAARSSATADDRVRAATEAWEAVATREPVLRGLARRRTMELLVRADRREEAERVARAAAATPTAEARGLLLRVATAYEAAQQFDRARPLYELVLQQQTDGADADRARVALARTLEALGRLDEAVVLWRDAQRRMRGTDTFRVARQGERAASARLGRPLAPFSESDYDGLSRRLAAASRFEDALELLREWQQVFPDSLDRDRVEVRRITALYNLRRNADARRAAVAFERDDRPLALRAEMTVMRFRLAVRDGLVAEASEMGNAIWSGRIGGVSAAERRSVASLLANYWLSLGRVDEALDLYRELYTTAPDLGDKRSYLLRLCIAAERAGQHTRAITNLRALLRLSPQGDARTGAEFWLGVALDGAGEREAGILALADVEVAYRHSYYGIRASERLNDLATRGIAAREVVGRARAARSSQLLFPDLLISNAATAAHDYQLGTSLLRTGLPDEGARQYRNVAARLTRDDALSLQAARASAAAADYRAAVGLVMSHFADTITRGAANEPDDLRTLAYPRPFWSEIQAAAAQAAVDPRLLVSLMRRESRFDPRARSAVGALGLFQIMPYTAADLAPGLGLAASTDDEMLEPRVNAAIAAALVARLTKLFGVALPPLVASYNAGEDRVSDWWRASAALPPELFVEMIPYAETRGFVREVLTNHEIYGRLYRSH